MKKPRVWFCTYPTEHNLERFDTIKLWSRGEFPLSLEPASLEHLYYGWSKGRIPITCIESALSSLWFRLALTGPAFFVFRILESYIGRVGYRLLTMRPFREPGKHKASIRACTITRYTIACNMRVIRVMYQYKHFIRDT